VATGNTPTLQATQLTTLPPTVEQHALVCIHVLFFILSSVSQCGATSVRIQKYVCKVRPWLQVCDKGAGSALLTRPKRLEAIARAASAVATRCGVTLKTRTAYYKEQMAHTVLPHAGEWGVQAVTLHGRTREQRYQRSADWEYVGKVAAEMPETVQLIGNGDVFSWEDFEGHMQGGKVRVLASACCALVCPICGDVCLWCRLQAGGLHAVEALSSTISTGRPLPRSSYSQDMICSWPRA
jgi:hypothetical protein